MSESRPASAAWPRIALAVLAVALAGAVGYIVHLHGQLPDIETRAAAPSRPAAAPQGQPAAPAPVISAIAAVLTPAQA